MAVVLLLLLFSFLSSATGTAHHRLHFVDRRPSLALTAPSIAQACKATRFQDTCVTSLTRSTHGQLPPKPGPLDIIGSALRVTSEILAASQTMVRSILGSSAGHLNRTSHAKNCLQVLPMSQHRIALTAEALKRGGAKDARAYMSAALQYQYDCWSELSYSNETSQVARTMSFLNNLMWLTSNALSMINSYDIYGPDTSSWRPPATERAGFWESGSGTVGLSFGSRGGFPPKVAAAVTVCKSGKGECSFRTVQDAVNSAPNNSRRRFVIHIKEGVYKEIIRVPVEKTNVVFLGDGMGKTVITGSLSVAHPGLFTYNTATVGIQGDGFMARGITFENTAGPDVHQAVAFRSDSDLSVVESCEFLGNQDTLYVHTLRQFYKSCRIEGNVDFIFGNAAAFFQDCVILVRPRQLNPEKGENNAVTAQGRTDPAQSTGLVFENCIINGTKRYMELYRSNPKVHQNFLGRPWKEYSRTVFIHCYMDALVARKGWMPFREDFALGTLYYGEFGNSGPGSGLSGRVAWSSKIPAKRVSTYSVQNFIQGNEWIPDS